MRRITFLLLCLFIGIGLSAQTRVSGTVFSAEDGQPVIGAAVVVKGTTTGTVTDYDGKFQLTTPAGAKLLVVSFMGMETQEVDVKPTINVRLMPHSESLDEVIVVAFGTVTKEAFTGSAATISSKSIDMRPIANAAKALEGVAAGVQVGMTSGQPGAGPEVRIRGFGSINASNDPLYVVDGVAYAGTLANLNPDDIESITVLKDAASSALYGSRAANGVVVITTKRGKSGRTTFDVKVNQGVSVRGIREYDRVGTMEYVPLQWEAMRNALVTGGASREAASLQASADIMGTKGLNNNPFNVAAGQVMRTDGTLNADASLLYNDFDWNDAISRTGYRGEYNISGSGGTDKADFFFSVGYLDEKGYVIRSDFNRFTARVNANIQPKKWFKAGVNVAGTVSTSTTTTASLDDISSYANPFYFARNIGPIYPIHQHNSDGSYVLDANGNRMYEWDHRGAGASAGRHIIAETQWNDNKNDRNVISTRLYSEVTFLPGLKLTINGGLNIDNLLVGAFENAEVGNGAPSGRSRRDNRKRTELNFNQLLSYNKSFGKHSMDLMAGHESYEYQWERFYGMKQGLVIDGNDELINFTTINSLWSFTDRYTTEGYLFRGNYNFDNRYYLSASYRRDGSSKFAHNVRWGNFWSLGGSWRIDREKFFEAKWVDMLKLRASYGQVGNDAGISYYAWQSLYNISNNGTESGFVQDMSKGNDKLEWESSNSLDIALEFGLFNRRLNGAFEFFDRRSSNLLFSVPLPTSSGVSNQYQNIGSMFNRGIELQLDGDIVRSKNFIWNMNVNATFLKNEITKLPQEEIVSGTKKLMVGKGIYDFWLRTYMGVNDQNGAAIYRYDDARTAAADVAKSYEYKGQMVTEDPNVAKFEYHGSSIPKVYGGLTNTFVYKNLSLSVLMTYGIGGQTYDRGYATLMEGVNSYGSAMHVDMNNRWQQPGDQTNVPRLDASKAVFFSATSSRWLTNSSYLALKNASLSYDLPKSVCRFVDLSAIRVFASGENLFLLSKRRGLNPQESFNGLTNNQYLPSRIGTVGVNVTF